MDLTTSLKARDTEDRQLVKSHATIFVVPSTMLYNRVRPRFEFHVGHSHKSEFFLKPVCCKKQQKIVPDQLLVCGVGDL